MEWLITAKKGDKCQYCKGSGFIPLEEKKMSKTSNLTIEIMCDKCEGKKIVFKSVELSLQSLKELLDEAV
jgi:excinuclease UvrABC ATPase subunit